MIVGKIVEIMADRKMTVQALASEAGVTPQTVMRARRQIANCRLSTLAALAGALGVKVKDLFQED